MRTDRRCILSKMLVKSPQADFVVFAKKRFEVEPSVLRLGYQTAVDSSAEALRRSFRVECFLYGAGNEFADLTHCFEYGAVPVFVKRAHVEHSIGEPRVVDIIVEPVYE